MQVDPIVTEFQKCSIRDKLKIKCFANVKTINTFARTKKEVTTSSFI